MRPTSKPEVKRIAMKVNKDTGRDPLQRRFRQRTTIARDVMVVIIIAIDRMRVMGLTFHRCTNAW